MSTRCDRCRVELEPREVRLRYLDTTFTVELPACPLCGQVFVSEDVARGRMREVEQMLEDK